MPPLHYTTHCTKLHCFFLIHHITQYDTTNIHITSYNYTTLHLITSLFTTSHHATHLHTTPYYTTHNTILHHTQHHITPHITPSTICCSTALHAPHSIKQYIITPLFIAKPTTLRHHYHHIPTILHYYTTQHREY